MVWGAEYKTFKIGELGHVVTGRTPPSSKPECFGSEYPFITPSDMKDERSVKTERYLSNEGALLLKNNLVPAGAVSVSCIGSQMGKSVLVTTPSFTNQQLNTVVPNDKVDSHYLYYLLSTMRQKFFSLGSASGVATPILNKGAFSDIEVRLPSLIVQQNLSSILKVYDDLIENNTRRITILETIAQNLYREWFVNFRFPGHEQSQWQGIPQGKVPAGWVVKKLYEIATVNSESITNKNAPEIIYYVDISSVNTGSIEEIKPMNFKEAPSRARRIVRHGDIIWATVRPNRKQFSYIANPVENTIVSTGFAVLRAEKVPASFLYQATTTDSFTAYLVNHATGAAYPAVNATVFENAEILVPDKDLLEKFDDLVAITMKQIEVLKKKNKNLKQQRDMLLSKLIGG